MQFATQLRRARLTYAVCMATITCTVMSAVTTAILSAPGMFWGHWPQVLGIDLCVAIPLTIALGPIIRRLCTRLYPGISK